MKRERIGHHHAVIRTDATTGMPDDTRPSARDGDPTGRAVIDGIRRTPGSTCVRLSCLAALASMFAACTSIPRSPAGPDASTVPRAPSGADVSVDRGRGEFTVANSMLDAWNAVGQILVRLDGVTYEGRAQMLGLYIVRYRGERLLIVTRALVIDSQERGLHERGMSTKVSAVLVDGRPSGSSAAVELLGLLHGRLPAELARIAAGER